MNIQVSIRTDFMKTVIFDDKLKHFVLNQSLKATFHKSISNNGL